LDEDNRRRGEIATRYCLEINNPLVELPDFSRAEHVETCRSEVVGLPHVWHVFAVTCKERDRLDKWLTDNGVQTNIHYPTPPHKQGAYTEFSGLKLPVTERLHQEILSLPISPVLTEQEVAEVIRLVNAFV
jgi:dTDP-4-amino-4,6-dideoxygalactose transaminase